ncbi:MAG TPA: glycosyltransferase [Pyrinomonadaceae bacterium]|nr:glycosyltransferase [Pyrinomonadaceae bacterium]
MAHIIFVQLPELGHINPTLKLARKLRRNGHQVSYVGLPDLEDYVKLQGVGFIPILARACPKGSLAGRRINLIEILDQLRTEGAVEIAAVLKTVKPDLLLVDVELLGVVSLARKLSIPCGLISTNLSGTRLISSNDARDMGLPILIPCPQEFDFPNAGTQPGHYYIEASIELDRTDPYPFPFERLDETRSLIYCSLGSHCEDFKETGSFFQTAIKVFRERPDCQLVLGTGRFQLNGVDASDLPENILLVSWAPQLALLKRAQIMITHGGLGTIKECIYAGVPMIVYAVMKDQPENAARVAYHGLGVSNDIKEVSIPQLHSAIDTIQRDSSFKTRVESMSKKFHAMESSGRGVRIVERILDWLRRNGRMPFEPYTGPRSTELHAFLKSNSN